MGNFVNPPVQYQTTEATDTTNQNGNNVNPIQAPLYYSNNNSEALTMLKQPSQQTKSTTGPFVILLALSPPIKYDFPPVYALIDELAKLGFPQTWLSKTVVSAPNKTWEKIGYRLTTASVEVFWKLIYLGKMQLRKELFTILQGEVIPTQVIEQAELEKQKALETLKQQKDPNETQNTNAVKVWGYLPPNNSELLPIPLTGALKGISITHVSCGSKHTLLLSDTGRLYSFGDGNYGQLGNGLKRDEVSPYLITKIKDIRITQVSCGATFSVALTETGNVIVFGTLKTSGGSKEVELFKYMDPHMLEELKRDHIVQIAAGAIHLLCLRRDGKVYSYGCSTYGRLGRGGHENEFTLIDSKHFKNDSVIKIASGHQHNLALTSSGNVFAWGRNDVLQCGMDTPVIDGNLQSSDPTALCIQFPTLVADLSKKGVTHIVCGPRNSAALAVNGVYTFGAHLGSRAVVPRDHTGYVRKVTYFDENKINVVGIDLGFNHCVVLTEEGKVMSWGSSHYGQLGVGNTETIEQPVHVSSLKEKIFKVAAGGNTTVAIAGLLSSLLTEEISMIFNKEEYFPDVVLKVDGTKIFAHKFILSARSEIFEKQFCNTTDAVIENDMQIIDLGDSFLINSVKTFLMYLYADRVDVISTDDERKQILTLAKKYEVKRLVELLELSTIKISPSTYASDMLSLLPQLDMTSTPTESSTSQNNSNTNNNALKSSQDNISFNTIFGIEYEDSRSSDSKVQIIKKKYIGDKFHDIEFVVEGRKIPANKALLAARSEYYRTIFQGKFKESSGKEIEVEEGITFDVFVCMLCYLYTDLTVKDVNIAIELLQLSSKLQLKRLMNICEKNIEKDIDSTTVVYVYQMAKFYGATRLQKYTLEFINLHKTEVMNSDFFVELSDKEREEVLNDATGNVSEAPVSKLK